MITMVTIAFWIAAATAWGCSGYIYYCGATGKAVNTAVIIRLVIASVIAMGVASIGNTLAQSVVMSAKNFWG